MQKQSHRYMCIVTTYVNYANLFLNHKIYILEMLTRVPKNIIFHLIAYLS
uniref:Uncharacterized protein n=1 Tax=Caudovirales sp. ct7oE3 TaxID=2826768 RepID=A0A8S5LZI7_9CAUD|nr:MAG TPA: hypothetical protein [Caudovirales sp. ct7oE3]